MSHHAAMLTFILCYNIGIVPCRLPQPALRRLYTSKSIQSFINTARYERDSRYLHLL